MPRGDGTGPQGQGSMTGRGMGQCSGGKKKVRPDSNSLGTPAGRPGGRGNSSGIKSGGTGRGLGRGQGNR
ncbi:MAG: DUF5320 domain-containing protein [Deltaproteobacteria bacterium]|nr:DUF5320 domain-containing protein [Deltaproteobacteria bacterium]